MNHGAIEVFVGMFLILVCMLIILILAGLYEIFVSIKKRFTWQNGRQNTGYQKITLIEKEFKIGKLSGFDFHIIKYNDGDSIPPHIDPVDENQHYRCNFILKKPKSGGEFYCEKYNKFWRFIFFRPDLYTHSVSKCVGTRYILSFGFCIKKYQSVKGNDGLKSS